MMLVNDKNKQYDVSERRELLLDYGKMVGKTVVFVYSEDTKYSSDRIELNLFIGKVTDCKWSTFINYPEFTVDPGEDGWNAIQVNAFALGRTMFENVLGVENVLKDFLLGKVFNFNRMLEREHKVSDLIWKTKLGFFSEYTLSERNQLLCLNKEQGTIGMVRVELLGDEFVLTNKTSISITQERIADTERYSYYTVDYDGESLIINEPEEFYKDVKCFIEMKLRKLDNQDLKLKSSVSEINNAWFDIQEKNLLRFSESEMSKRLKDVMTEVLEEKMPEIIEEVMVRLLD